MEMINGVLRSNINQDVQKAIKLNRDRLVELHQAKKFIRNAELKDLRLVIASETDCFKTIGVHMQVKESVIDQIDNEIDYIQTLNERLL